MKDKDFGEQDRRTYDFPTPLQDTETIEQFLIIGFFGCPTSTNSKIAKKYGFPNQCNGPNSLINRSKINNLNKDGHKKSLTKNVRLVEDIGVEPTTSCMPCKRSSQLS